MNTRRCDSSIVQDLSTNFRMSSDADIIVRMCMLRCRGLNACTNGWFDLDVYWFVLPQDAIHSTVYGLALAVCNARCQCIIFSVYRDLVRGN